MFGTTPTHTVTVSSVATTNDDLGNTTDTPTNRTATGILFAPEGLVEGAGTNTPRVLGTATLYGNTGPCGADDEVVHASGCCSGAAFPFGTWQVVGGSKGWGGDNYAVPLKQVRTS